MTFNKTKAKFIVDILMFIDFLVVAVSGFVLKIVYTAGERSGQAGTLFLFDRFEWLHIHSVASIVFIVLLLIHLILNWGWVKSMFKGLIRK